MTSTPHSGPENRSESTDCAASEGSPPGDRGGRRVATDGRGPGAAEASSAGAEADADAETSVLILEDEEELADMYTRWLDPAYTVHTAYTGEQALDIVDEHDIDVAILDRRLPGMSGDEVLAQLRERGVDCRASMLTAIDTDYDILDMEFDDYVTKPVFKEDLHDLVERLAALDRYDRLVEEIYRIDTKRSALRSAKPAEELENNEEYQRLERRRREVRERIDDIADRVDDTGLIQLLEDAE